MSTDQKSGSLMLVNGHIMTCKQKQLSIFFYFNTFSLFLR